MDCRTKQLLEHLSSMQVGHVSDVSRLEALLAACWDEFDGSDAEQMAGYKLHDRIEDAVWNPPVLSFNIERHEALGVGSTRAGRHKWEIDVEKRTAICKKVGYRQVVPRQPKLNVRPIAEEIVQLIVARQEDER